MFGWVSRSISRVVRAEPVRTAGWFRCYYFANREGIAEPLRARIESLLALPMIDRCELAELIGEIVNASTPPALRQWREILAFENRMLLDLPHVAASAGSEQPERDVESLRSEVAMLLAQIARLRSVRRSLSLVRTAVCAAGLALSITYLVLGLLATGVIKQGSNSDWLSLLIPIVILGGLGGMTSGLSRLYSIRWRGPSLLMYTHITSLGLGLMLNLLLASFEGIVFAIVLYAFFSAGFLQGGLFPKITWLTGAAGDWLSYVNDGGPDSLADIGKVVVWSFIAGWSERFVPDLMRQMTAQAHETSARGAELQSPIGVLATAED